MKTRYRNFEIETSKVFYAKNHYIIYDILKGKEPLLSGYDFTAFDEETVINRCKRWIDDYIEEEKSAKKKV
jgi:hypothetical protein